MHPETEYRIKVARYAARYLGLKKEKDINRLALEIKPVQPTGIDIVTINTKKTRVFYHRYNFLYLFVLPVSGFLSWFMYRMMHIRYLDELFFIWVFLLTLLVYLICSYERRNNLQLKLDDIGLTLYKRTFHWKEIAGVYTYWHYKGYSRFATKYIIVLQTNGELYMKPVTGLYSFAYLVNNMAHYLRAYR